MNASTRDNIAALIYGTPEELDRFVSKIEFTPTCWLWSGYASNGYGQVWFRNKQHPAHRVAFLLTNGSFPPPCLEIDHLCRVRRCVNPAHLEAVTPEVNCLRGESPPAINARKTHCFRGHAFTPENTIRAGAHGRQCRVCMRLRSGRWYVAVVEARRRAGLDPKPIRPLKFNAPKVGNS